MDPASAWTDIRQCKTHWRHVPVLCSDKSVKPPTALTYVHWGRIGDISEPNNGTGMEACGIANASMSYGEAWGWADVQCTLKSVFICKMAREWLWQATAAD
jgi:hypothetical protein